MVGTIAKRIAPLAMCRLAAIAREIAARRTGVYVLSEDEEAVIAEARREALVPDHEAAAFWRRHSLR